MPDPTPSRDNLADAQAAAGPCPHHAVAKAWPMMINTIARGFAYRESETAERDARVKALEAEVAELELTIKGKTFSYPPDERDERIKALEAEVASVTDNCRYWRESFFDLRDSKRNNVVLDDAIRELHEREAQLRRHGQHTDECKRFGTPPECTCGWTAIEEGLDGD